MADEPGHMATTSREAGAAAVPRASIDDAMPGPAASAGPRRYGPVSVKDTRAGPFGEAARPRRAWRRARTGGAAGRPSTRTEAYITGTGAFLPGDPVTNEELAARCGTAPARDPPEPER